jgi:hypothetical protein
MTAINFPDDPEIGDTFSAGSTTWEWTGSVWKGFTTPVQGPPGEDGADGESNFNSFLLMGA